MTGPAAHHKYGFSGASRYLACPGSMSAQEGKPDSSSVFAEEGTSAHECAENRLLFWKGKEGATRALQEWNKAATADGYDVKEIVRETDKYVEYVCDLAAGDPDAVTVEQRVKVTLGPVEDITSTADAVVLPLGPKGEVRTVHVADLKYGKGKQVFAENNAQLRLYAYGVVKELIDTDVLDDVLDDFDEIKIVTHICQPRLDHFDSEELTLTDLIDWVELRVIPTIERIEDGDTTRSAGPDCQFCKAEADCRTRAEQVTSELHDDFDDFVEEGPDMAKPDTLSPAEIGRILDHKKAIESWLKSVAAHAYATIENGGEIPGHKIVAGRNSRSWEDDDEALEAFKKQRALKQDEFAPRKLLTPAQAEKVLPKGSKILDLIVSAPGKPTLVDASNKKPALSFEPVESMFDGPYEDEDDLLS